MTTYSNISELVINASGQEIPGRIIGVRYSAGASQTHPEHNVVPTAPWRFGRGENLGGLILEDPEGRIFLWGYTIGRIFGRETWSKVHHIDTLYPSDKARSEALWDEVSHHVGLATVQQWRQNIPHCHDSGLSREEAEALLLVRKGMYSGEWWLVDHWGHDLDGQRPPVIR